MLRCKFKIVGLETCSLFKTYCLYAVKNCYVIKSMTEGDIYFVACTDCIVTAVTQYTAICDKTWIV